MLYETNYICITRFAHLEVLCDAGVVVVLEGREEAGPDDVGLGRPQEGGGRSQLGVEQGQLHFCISIKKCC